MTFPLPSAREAQLWDELTTEAIYHTDRLEGNPTFIRKWIVWGVHELRAPQLKNYWAGCTISVAD